MNNEIRKMLIERARLKAPVAYGVIMQQLGLDNAIPEHRKMLSHELAVISRFEHSKERPMLSSMAMYEGLKKIGPGFYPLAEELEYGEATQLERKKFAYEMQKRCNEFWKDESNFKLFANDTAEGKIIIDPIAGSVGFPFTSEFFKQDEIILLGQWAGNVYDKNDKKHVAAKNSIMNSLGSKTVYWSEELIKQLKGFDTFNWRMWSQKGWEDTDEGKRRVARFKHYTWARIFKTGDANKDIFFTIGVDGNTKEIVYKLDYYFEANSKLSASQKELCEQLIPDDLSWIAIPFDDVPKYNWIKLIAESAAFIKDNESLYDEIIQSVWSETVNVSKLKNRLIKRDIPENGVDEIPKRTFTFQGIEIDWEEQNRIFADIGKLGEELVIEYERRKLKEAKKENYADDVKKVDDGDGYDIFSRNMDGGEKKIEVKTTTGNSDKDFPISLQEIKFSEINPTTYSLYRVFNLNKAKRVAEFHEYKGNLNEHFLFEGAQFNAFRRKKQ